MKKQQFSLHSVRLFVFIFLIFQSLFNQQSFAQIYIHTNENVSQSAQLKAIESVEIKKQPEAKKPSTPHSKIEKIFKECKIDLRKLKWDFLDRDIYLKNNQLLKFEELQQKYPWLNARQIQCTQNNMRGL